MDQLDPPSNTPKYLREGLQKQSPDVLRSIATYASNLADLKERALQEELDAKAVEVNEDKTPDGWECDEWDEQLKDSNAPPRATLTIKTIDERDYYYFQWREGDKIKSEYVAPVSPSGSSR